MLLRDPILYQTLWSSGFYDLPNPSPTHSVSLRCGCVLYMETGPHNFAFCLAVISYSGLCCKEKLHWRGWRLHLPVGGRTKVYSLPLGLCQFSKLAAVDSFPTTTNSLALRNLETGSRDPWTGADLDIPSLRTRLWNMVPEGTTQASKAGRQPTVLASYDTYKTQQWPTRHNNPKGAVATWISCQ